MSDAPKACEQCEITHRRYVPPPIGLPLKAPPLSCVVCTDTLAPLSKTVFVCQKCSYMAFRLWPAAPVDAAAIARLRVLLADLGGARARRMILRTPAWRRPRATLAVSPDPR